MIQEIFIVEDKEEIIKELKPKFKGKKGFALKRMSSRRIARTFIRHAITNPY